jgi:uncharacterized protein (TIGR03435 family)
MRSVRSLFAQISLAVFFFSSQLLFSQTPAPLAFEVASIKLAPSISTMLSDFQSGKHFLESMKATMNDARIDYSYISMKSLLMLAYGLKENQIASPDYMSGQVYEIHAKLPEGAEKEQVPQMLQSLLKERFRLKIHKEKREKSIYALVVSKDGHKLKEANTAIAENNESNKSDKPGSGKTYSFDSPDGVVNFKEQDGSMTMSSGKTGQLRVGITENGGMSMEAESLAMSGFADLLTSYADKPVVNMTGLNGKYHISLEFTGDDLGDMRRASATKEGISLPAVTMDGASITGSSPGDLAVSSPSSGGIFKAVQKLGLKLDSRKMQIDTLVVDYIDKIPTEN